MLARRRSGLRDGWDWSSLGACWRITRRQEVQIEAIRPGTLRNSHNTTTGNKMVVERKPRCRNIPILNLEDP